MSEAAEIVTYPPLVPRLPRSRVQVPIPGRLQQTRVSFTLKGGGSKASVFYSTELGIFSITGPTTAWARR
ncbi:hypothetical protein KRM28CT15_04930 [Krasilnikovia sp. M28-CT-15]